MGGLCVARWTGQGPDVAATLSPLGLTHAAKKARTRAILMASVFSPVLPRHQRPACLAGY